MNLFDMEALDNLELREYLEYFFVFVVIVF